MDIYLKTLFTVLEVGSGRVFISAMGCLPEAAALQWDGWDLRTRGHLFKLVACSSTVSPPYSLWSLCKSLFTGGAWDPDSLHAWEKVRVSSRRLTLIQLCSLNQAKKRVLVTLVRLTICYGVPLVICDLGAAFNLCGILFSTIQKHNLECPWLIMIGHLKKKNHCSFKKVKYLTAVFQGTNLCPPFF